MQFVFTNDWIWWIASFSAWAVKPSCAFGTSYHQIVFFFIISTNRTPLTFVFFWGLWVFFFRCFACFSDVLQVGKIKKNRKKVKPQTVNQDRFKIKVRCITDLDVSESCEQELQSDYRQVLFFEAYWNLMQMVSGYYRVIFKKLFLKRVLNMF